MHLETDFEYCTFIKPFKFAYVFPPKKIFLVLIWYFLGNFVKVLQIPSKTTSAEDRDIDKRFVSLEVRES